MQANPDTDGRTIARSLVAWTAATVSVLCATAGLVIRARNAAVDPTLDELYLSDVWISFVAPVIGAYLISRTNARLLGWLLMCTGALGIGSAAANYALHLHLGAGSDASDPSAAVQVGSWLATWTWTPFLLLLCAVPFLVPGGTTASERWRHVLRVALGAVALTTVLAAVRPGPLAPYPRLHNPIGIDASWLPGVADAAAALTAVTFATLGLASAVMRRRTSTEPVQRRHAGWFLAAIAVLAVSVIGSGDLPYPWVDLVPSIGFTGLLAVIVISVTSTESAIEEQRSQEQVVVAREDERFRIHRDLHDGLGPELAGLALHLNALASSVSDEAVRSELGHAEDSLRRMVDEVRRIVDDLRPPALDQLGLAGALDERAASMSRASGVAFDVEATRLDRVPPAVEVAAYRIACEAMTNVARHAGARRCVISLHGDDGAVRMEVTDDGHGMADDARRGVGTTSMRIRAEELGGELHVGPARGSTGVAVVAVLPLAVGS